MKQVRLGSQEDVVLWDSVKVEFREDGRAADGQEVTAAAQLAAGGATDLLLVAHGWNNDISQAEALFRELCDNAARLHAQDPDGRRVAVVRLLWPSVRWADDDQLAGGGASAGDEVLSLLAALRERVPAGPARDRLLASAHGLEGSSQARADFVAALRCLLPADAQVADDDPLPGALRHGDVAELFDRAAEAERAVAADDDVPPVLVGSGPPGVYDDVQPAATRGGAVGLDLDLSFLRSARSLLNLTTYYTMKARAADVGRHGVGPLVETVHAAAPGVRLHLAGHSFGARVVTAAASAADVPVASLTLLQAAFSHHAFSSSNVPPGAFREVLENGRLTGPLVVTHTHNDRAVRHAYAVASFLANQVASALGDEDSRYGGLGANGAVKTDGAVRGTLGPAGTAYAFQPGRVHNLRADQQVSGHGDVRNPAVAHALLQAMECR